VAGLVPLPALGGLALALRLQGGAPSSSSCGPGCVLAGRASAGRDDPAIVAASMAALTARLRELSQNLGSL